MKIRELKSGMIVTLANKQRYMVLRDTEYGNGFILLDGKAKNGKNFIRFSMYSDSTMKFITANRNKDIVKVEAPAHTFNTYKVLYERNKKVKLTIAEIEEKLGHKIVVVD